MARQHRHQLIRPEEVPHYHLMSRCARRQMLMEDPKRKDFMLAWLKALDGAYAVEVCRYALMDNHFHAVVRVNVEAAKAWTAAQVVTRWAQLHPPRDGRHRPLKEDDLVQWIANLAHMPEAVEALREKLMSVSQFMKDFKQRVAEVFNKEDHASGVFWQGRFQSVPLASESSLLAGMAYVDLNPHAANLCEKPEDDPHTSLHASVKSREKEQRERAKRKERPSVAEAVRPLSYAQLEAQVKRNAPATIEVVPDAERHAWMVPVGGAHAGAGVREAGRKSLFPQLRLEDYLRLVDFVARQFRSGKAQLNAAMEGILERSQVGASDVPRWVAQVVGWLREGRIRLV
jgi:REP element-mobilizing transposase RayT